MKFNWLDKLEKAGDDLVIYRPALNPNAPVKPMTLTNSQGESRTELLPAGALAGQKLTGRPVYDTTSTGVGRKPSGNTTSFAPFARRGLLSNTTVALGSTGPPQ